jgi:hypothetical protein
VRPRATCMGGCLCSCLGALHDEPAADCTRQQRAVGPKGRLSRKTAVDSPPTNVTQEVLSITEVGWMRRLLTQEIDALETALMDPMQCVVCCTHERNAVVLPCGHLALCATCAETWFAIKDTCPMCCRDSAYAVRVWWN